MVLEHPGRPVVGQVRVDAEGIDQVEVLGRVAQRRSFTAVGEAEGRAEIRGQPVDARPIDVAATEISFVGDRRELPDDAAASAPEIQDPLPGPRPILRERRLDDLSTFLSGPFVDRDRVSADGPDALQEIVWRQGEIGRQGGAA